MDVAQVATESVRDITNHWQVIALLIICGFSAFGLWIHKSAGDNKKLIAKSDELERQRTENRKLERDRQIKELEKKIEYVEKQSNGVGTSFDKCTTKHEEINREIFTRLGAIEKGQVDKGDFSVLQRDVRNIEKTVVEIHTLVKGGFLKNDRGYKTGN